MSISLTIANEILKVDYQDIVRDVMNSATVLNARLERDWDSVQGELVYFGLNVSRNNSFASRSGGTGTYLPPAGAQGYDASTFTIPEMYGRLQVMQRDIKASRNSKGALLRILDAEVRNYIRDCKVALNRMNYGDGSGIVARVLSITDATTFVVQTEHNHGSNPTYGSTVTYWGTRFLQPGMLISFAAAKTSGVTKIAGIVGLSGTATDTYVQVVSADRVTGIVVVDTLGGVALNGGGGTDVAVDDYVAIHGSRGNDQMGLVGIVDDGSRADERFFDVFQGIDRSDPAKNWWNANVMHNSGIDRNISLRDLQDLCDEIEIQGDGMVNLMLTTYGIRSEILALLLADKRFSAPFEMELDGGFRSLSYNGIPIVPDKDAPKHMLFGMDESTVKFYSMSDMEWLEEDGSVLHRVPNEPKYEATGFLYRQMGCTDPRNLGRIDDLVDPTNL